MRFFGYFVSIKTNSFKLAKNTWNFFKFALLYYCCAMWGDSGALNLQSALARQNIFLGNACLEREFNFCDEIKVLCNGWLWTMSGPEGSSIKQTLPCAIRVLWWSKIWIRSSRLGSQKRLHSFFLEFSIQIFFVCFFVDIA